jgi:hypothetical protein
MSAILVVFWLNGMFLLLHEIESAFEKEWEILKLPGEISAFLSFHIPIILLLFWGSFELEKASLIGSAVGIVFGVGGLLPFLIHKVFVRRDGHFNRIFSNVIIYTNVVVGITLLLLSLLLILK